MVNKKVVKNSMHKIKSEWSFPMRRIQQSTFLLIPTRFSAE